MKTPFLTFLLSAQLASAANPSPPTTQTCKPHHLIAAEKVDRPESFAKAKQPCAESVTKA